MDPKFQFLFYLAAAICFAWEAVGLKRPRGVSLLAVGLLLFVIPFMWNAAEAGW